MGMDRENKCLNKKKKGESEVQGRESEREIGND